MSITIRTRKGKLIQRRAVIADTIDNGRVKSWAQVGIHLYAIKERTSSGNIWHIV